MKSNFGFGPLFIILSSKAYWWNLMPKCGQTLDSKGRSRQEWTEPDELSCCQAHLHEHCLYWTTSNSASHGHHQLLLEPLLYSNLVQLVGICSVAIAVTFAIAFGLSTIWPSAAWGTLAPSFVIAARMSALACSPQQASCSSAHTGVAAYYYAILIVIDQRVAQRNSGHLFGADFDDDAADRCCPRLSLSFYLRWPGCQLW